ncbi:MAG: response regulator transcription factor [Rhizobiales bacterium]|nr:response regulator transcription factor [Hyphomicrobiales bacterium]
MDVAMDGRKRRHILLVEDDVLVSAMVKDALEYAGFEVTALDAAEDAVGLAMADVPFDLVVTDINLSGPMDGWELAETMREMRGGVPIIYASAQVYAEGSGMRVGNSLTLAKPYSPIALCKLIRELLAPSDAVPDIAPTQRKVIHLHERRALIA